MLAVLFFITTSSGSLSELIAVAKGDMAGLQLNHYAVTMWEASLKQYDVYLFSFFDKGTEKITVEIHGIDERIEKIRGVIEHFHNLIFNDFIPFLKTTYGIDIHRINDLRILYRTRTEEGRRVLYLLEDGKFLFPVR